MQALQKLNTMSGFDRCYAMPRPLGCSPSPIFRFSSPLLEQALRRKEKEVMQQPAGGPSKLPFGSCWSGLTLLHQGLQRKAEQEMLHKQKDEVLPSESS